MLMPTTFINNLSAGTFNTVWGVMLTRIEQFHDARGNQLVSTAQGGVFGTTHSFVNVMT
jgi:hypothetical protein